MPRPRKQDGWLRVERGSWLGTWRVYGKDEKSFRRTITLGRASDLTEAEARAQLAAIIDKDTEQFDAVRFLSTTARGKHKARQFKVRDMAGSGNIGAFSELVVALDLLEKGFHVYRAVSPTAACDLMVCDDAGEHRLRIEVKTAECRKDRTPFVKVTRNLGKFDVLAIVLRDGSIDYRTHNGIQDLRIFLVNSDLQLTSEATETA